MRTVKEEKDGERIFIYYLSSDAGKPLHASLYGAARDPLKGIGHCGMRIIDKNNVMLITGCIVEDDWVEMKPEYLDSLDVYAEKKVEKPARISLSKLRPINV